MLDDLTTTYFDDNLSAEGARRGASKEERSDRDLVTLIGQRIHIWHRSKPERIHGEIDNALGLPNRPPRSVMSVD